MTGDTDGNHGTDDRSDEGVGNGTDAGVGNGADDRVGHPTVDDAVGVEQGAADGPRGLAESLLLLCADPTSGRLRRPQYMRYAVVGAVLTDLVLAGAVTVADRSITGVPRPLPTGDPYADDLLTRVAERLGKRDRMSLGPRIRDDARGFERRCIDGMAAKGLLTATRTRLLGLVPHTVHTAVHPDVATELTARIRRELDERSDPRVLHLAMLASTVGLHRRLFRGKEGRPVHRTIRELARADPISRAVAREISRDRSNN